MRFDEFCGRNDEWKRQNLLQNQQLCYNLNLFVFFFALVSNKSMRTMSCMSPRRSQCQKRHFPDVLAGVEQQECVEEQRSSQSCCCFEIENSSRMPQFIFSALAKFNLIFQRQFCFPVCILPIPPTCDGFASLFVRFKTVHQNSLRVFFFFFHQILEVWLKFASRCMKT